jgi:nucleoside-diphosphate-sugar epimerase
MNGKILITGGAGCLGSNLIEHYFPQGFAIKVIDNFATGKKEVVPEQDRLSIIEGSIEDTALVEQTFADFRPDYVIHSAASYKDPSDWSEDTKTNILGTINIVKASEKYGVKRLINFQTALCYGRPNIVPIPVNHPTSPFTSYGVSKTAGESYLMQADLQTISFRLANICGPRLAIGPIPTFYKRLKAGQNCFCSETVRDFLDMSDFVNLMDLAIQEKAPSGVFNVSTGVGNTIHDVFSVVSSYLNIEVPEVPIVPVGDDDVAEVVLDPVQTEKAFNWKANVNFEETINNQLRWYDKYGINDIFSHLADPTVSSQ